MTTKGFLERRYEKKRRELIPVETVVEMYDDEVTNVKALKKQLIAKIALLCQSRPAVERETMLRLTAEGLDDCICRLEDRRAEYSRKHRGEDSEAMKRSFIESFLSWFRRRRVPESRPRWQRYGDSLIRDLEPADLDDQRLKRPQRRRSWLDRAPHDTIGGYRVPHFRGSQP